MGQGLRAGAYGNSGNVTIGEDAALTVKAFMGMFVGNNSHVRIEGTLDTTECDFTCANLLGSKSSLTLTGTVKMHKLQYIWQFSSDAEISPTEDSTGVIYVPTSYDLWVLSDATFGKWTSNDKLQVKKLHMSPNTLFTIPAGKEINIEIESLSDLNGGYIKIESDASGTVKAEGFTPEQIEALNLFCGKVKVNDNDPVILHAGGTPTCSAKKKCVICNEEYGDFGSHSLIKHEAKAATCTKDGNTLYWNCSVCNKNFSDEAGTQEAGDISIRALPHDYGDLIAERPATYENTGMKAHYVCSMCNTYFDADKNQTTDVCL